MIVRAMTLNDVCAINSLVSDFIDEALIDYGFTFNADNINRLVEACQSYTLVMESTDGEIVGVLAGLLAPSFVNGEMVYQEIMWYVRKEFRRSGLKLLDAAENLCRQLGIKKIVMAHLGNSFPETLAKLYHRRGYKQLEIQYIKEL